MPSSPFRRAGVLASLILVLPGAAASKNDRPKPDGGKPVVCATTPERVRNVYARGLYYQDLEHRRRTRTPLAVTEPAPAAADSGDIAVVEDDGSIVVQANSVDLSSRSFRFEPASSTEYRVVSASSSFSSSATPVRLLDDDSTSVSLGFTFTFFGKSYTSVFFNSDGNLTFEAADSTTDERDLSRFTSGKPRIGPFFADLDPSFGVTGTRSESDGMVFVWSNTPYFDTNLNNSFSVKLFRNGNIELTYGTVRTDSQTPQTTIAGIAPGSNQGTINAVKFTRDLPTGSLAGAIVELFTTSGDFSEFALAKKFFQTHPDDFDHLIVFMGFPYNDVPFDTSFAYEINARNEVSGIGNSNPIVRNGPIYDYTELFGSAGRLRSFVNMGPLSGPGRYPDDPNQLFFGTNSTIGILGQESGHRWLAFVTFQDGSTTSSALLGRANQHWSFFFDSDASDMEGNDIQDRGEGASPRFATVDATSRYSRLDQYVMGLVGKEDVPPLFVVQSPTGTSRRASSAPEIGVTFSGTRKDVTIDNIIAANGARSPSVLASPKVFRQAFILLTRRGEPATADQIAKVQRIRDAWVKFFNDTTEKRGWVVTDLQRTPGVTASNIYFPYFSGDAKRFTGIAVANWGTKPADVLFKAFDNAGNSTSTPSSIINPRMITIPPGEQIAMLAEQIHGLGLGDARNGWIQADSTSSQVTGFFLDGDIDQTLLDGAVAGGQTATELYFTRAQLGSNIFAAGNTYRNLIDVINPGSTPATLDLKLMNELGAVVATASRTLAPRGRLAENLSALFPNAGAQRSTGYVKVTSTAGVVGYQSLDGGTSVFALPAQTASTVTKLYSAQFASGASGTFQFFTDCNLINTSGSSRSVQLQLVGNDGAPVAGVATVTRNLAPGAQLRTRGDTLFGLANAATSPALVEGSLVVTADGPGVIGDITFGDAVNERFMASLPLDGTPVTNLVFSQVAQGNPDGGKPYFTGIAMYNSGTTDCTVTIDVYSEKGVKTGTAAIPLAKGNRISKTLPQLVPAISSQVRGYIRLTVTGGSIVAFELFGDQALEFLAAVPPQPITP
jgi:hypothetical protein